MTLARKLAIKIVAVVVGLATIGTASVWGLLGLRGYFDATGDRYRELRRVYEVGHEAAAARMLLRDGSPRVERSRRHIESALQKARRLREETGPPLAVIPEWDQLQHALVRHLDGALEQMPRAETPDEPTAINEALGRVAGLANRIKRRIVANRRAATTRFRWTIAVVAGLAGITIASSVVLGINIYRSVTRPLRRLERGVDHAAATDFTERLPADGDRELARIAERFNHMAGELDRLYRGLEAEVEAKSRQLVRSERLASIGHLAAGFAHEINNPLAIIIGHAEAARRRSSGPERERAIRPDHALRIVREEAERCSSITERLLRLGQTGEAPHGPVDLAKLTRRTVRRMQRMPMARDRSLEHGGPDADVVVSGDEAELTQLVTNLVANALECAPAGTGCVRSGLARGDRFVTLRVSDNGPGIAAELVGTIFEPFYTDKPRRDRRGVGLGLSLVHAIVERHGGRVRVETPESGAGSAFVVELPAAYGSSAGPTVSEERTNG